NIGTALMLGIILYSPLNNFLKLAPLSFRLMLQSGIIAIVSVFWYELVKLYKKVKNKKKRD
ncbi:MAG: hypothetical protein RR315_08305, partial [Oscillospiraceae bacterium]